MSASSRNRAISMGSGRSGGVRSAQTQEFGTMPSTDELRFFDPCAATGSMFLYAQGTSVVCCHHDTLTIERRFSNHAEEVQLLAVDNQSDVGSGRFVVSYDAGQTAIVWDLMTGSEVTRFASYDALTAVAFMRNGNIAFGNAQGSIMLFEPETSEHISSRTLDQIAVTALAPSSDCRTFAIGYSNGSLLIATLQPRFTILHNLSTSRTPSPIVTLAWHASSSRQKSDMLATQTHNGDLRVWSVAKSLKADDPAKVVRILKRSENMSDGQNWMGWSKNGRIIQFSDSQTQSWDVRTKHVTSDSIPTLEQVKGLAVWGPGASLFTLGPNNTVQQFDLNSPSIMVANVQHPANLLPPSPPNSIEEPGSKSAHSATTIHSSTTIHTSTSESESSSIPMDMNISESDEDHLPAIARFHRRPQPDSGNEFGYDSTGSPISSRSGVSSQTRSSAAGSRTPGRYPGSLKSRGMSENTYISAGSSINTSTIGGGNSRRDIDNYSMGYSIGSTSLPSVSSASRTGTKSKPSRLRNEIPRSPDDNKVHDLFKFTRTRLSDLPYKRPSQADNSRLTNDDLRRQMLSTIFGWHMDVEDLIRDEMSRHSAGSSNRILLAKWLGDMETDILAAKTENMTSSDWMLLALSGIGGHASQHKLGNTYVQRLLETGDVHVAVTIMLGMGDHNDAVEVYVSHKRYMEALILTCLAFPGVWERQAAIIRKWGEWAVQHGQQQLAIRCFACTDKEPTEMWTSPSATQLNFQSVTPSIPEVLSPPLSPPGFQRGPQRSIAKTSALKLITSFGDQQKKSKFYSQNDDTQTPIAAGATPIAESAVTPGGSYEAATAFLRPSNNSRFNTPTSAKASGPTFGRGRLPSIGELPANLNRGALKAAVPPTPPAIESGHQRTVSAEQNNLAAGKSLHRAATASPMMMRERSHSAATRLDGEHPPPPTRDFMAKVEGIRANRRNGSRDRIPQGLSLDIETPDADGPPGDVVSPDQSVGSSRGYHWPSRRRGTGSVTGSVTSNSSAGRNLRHNQRSREDYIHSLDTAARAKKSSRQKSKDRTRESSKTRHTSRSRERRTTKSREQSEDRGRAAARAFYKPKRSPTSPIPMSPEDLANLSTPRLSETGEPITVRKASSSYKSKPKSRNSSRGGSRSRRQSPDGKGRLPIVDGRGRSKGRDEVNLRSPASPLPLSATVPYFQGSEDEEDYQKAVLAQEKFRARHNGSRDPASPAVTRREQSETRAKEASEARDTLPSLLHSRATSTEHAGDLRRMKEERQRKREQAARDLEERRKSLAQRSVTPSIPHPSQYSPGFPRIGVEMADSHEDLPPRSATEPPRSMQANGPYIGLPATPKAMRLIRDDGLGQEVQSPAEALPAVPPIPSTFAQRHSPKTSPNNSPEKEKEDALLTLLPSTVYQPPARPGIPRSMSAPIPDEPSPTHPGRKGSMGEVRGIDEVMGAAPRRRSQEDAAMPPPPPPPPMPVPPMLKELQHLASPPPPPPAPLPYGRQPAGQSAALSSGMIEIVMDDDEPEVPAAIPNDGMVPVLSPPAPPGSKGHSRGRSVGDSSSLSGRFSKATERLRSASRGRKEKLKSPHVEAPYESVPSLPQHPKTPAGAPPPVHYDPDAIRSPVEGRRISNLSTGLHRSEMI